MEGGAQGRVDRLRTDILMKWTAFVAEVTTGRDERGNVAHQGELATVWEKPGTVQIPMVVRRSSGRGGGAVVVEVGRIVMSGIGDQAKRELQLAARPLGTAAMHRELRVAFVDRETGAQISMGRIDVGPEQQLDVDEAHWVELAMLAGGDAPDARVPAAAEGMVRHAEGVSKERAEAGARFLLSQVTKTTADLE